MSSDAFLLLCCGTHTAAADVLIPQRKEPIPLNSKGFMVLIVIWAGSRFVVTVARNALLGDIRRALAARFHVNRRQIELLLVRGVRIIDAAPPLQRLFGSRAQRYDLKPPLDDWLLDDSRPVNDLIQPFACRTLVARQDDASGRTPSSLTVQEGRATTVCAGPSPREVAASVAGRSNVIRSGAKQPIELEFDMSSSSRVYILLAAASLLVLGAAMSAAKADG